jgi:hypothetical protein
MIEVSTALGLSVFMSALSVAVALFLVDRYERIDLSLPFGPAIPYTIAVFGAMIFFFAEEGIIGVMKTLASAIAIGAVIKYTRALDSD